jgi:ABC-2 type transport system permease protein
MLLHALYSEWIKLRRTPAAWLTVLFPIVCILIIDLYLYVTHRLSWNNLLLFAFSFWIMLWPAGGVALQAALAADYDRQEKRWQALRVRPVALAALFGAKILVQEIHLLLHSLFMSGLILLTGILLRVPGDMPWLLLLILALISTFLILPLQVLYIWIATATGIGMAIALGAIGLLLEALLGGTSMGEHVWLFIPWAWPMRLFLLLSNVWINLHGDFSSSGAQPGMRLLPIPLVATLILLVGITIASLHWFCSIEPTNDV